MWLKLNLDGIDFHLQINNYRHSKKEIWDEQWCRVSCSFIDEKYSILNYRTTENELLLCCEVEKIAASLQKLLDNILDSKTELSFIEPDFELILSPKLENGYISTEWKVYLWRDGLTTNYFSIDFSSEELKCLLAYLKIIIGEFNENTPIIKEMLNSGMLYG